MGKKQNINVLVNAQRFEATEYEIYQRLLKIKKNEKNRQVFESLAQGSKKHAEYWEKITGVKVAPSKFKILIYIMIFRIFGLAFGTRFMEQSEKKAEKMITEIIKIYPEHSWILAEEKIHEQKLFSLIDEDRLHYLGSVALGANDAIVSTVGTAAGLSIALSSVHLIGMTSIISGATAALSMSASSYISTLSEKTNNKKPILAGVYTGITYIITVIILVIPYFVVEERYPALFVTLFVSTIIIALLSFYLSIIQQASFLKRFLQNVSLSIGIAIISFIIGYLVNVLFGV